MTMDLAIEFIGRYFLTGIIACGVAFLLLVIRLLYMVGYITNRDGNWMDFLRIITDTSDKKSGKKPPIWKDILETAQFIAGWPYTLLRAAKTYFSMEDQALEKMEIE